MDIPSIKTGDIFYYDEYLAHKDEIHRHKCRVLFVGSESIFYDGWWELLNQWTFVPVKKRLTYYRFSLTNFHQLTNLRFNGFESIDPKSATKLFLESPEILLRSTKTDLFRDQSDNTVTDMHSEAIAFVPIGPKNGWLKPVFFDTNGLTKGALIQKIMEHQNLDFIQGDEIVIDRIGLHNGVPSYSIKTW